WSYFENDLDRLRSRRTYSLCNFGETFRCYTHLILARLDHDRELAIPVRCCRGRGKAITGGPDVSSRNSGPIWVDHLATQKNLPGNPGLRKSGDNEDGGT